jgi:hypothetical protein
MGVVKNAHFHVTPCLRRDQFEHCAGSFIFARCAEQRPGPLHEDQRGGWRCKGERGAPWVPVRCKSKSAAP